MNTVQTRFFVLKLPELDCSCLLDWTLDSLQTNPPATLFFWYFHSLSSLCVHTLTWSEIFFMLHSLSETVSLAKLDHQTHSHLLNHLWNLTSSSYPTDSLSLSLSLCVCVCIEYDKNGLLRCMFLKSFLLLLCLSSVHLLFRFLFVYFNFALLAFFCASSFRLSLPSFLPSHLARWLYLFIFLCLSSFPRVFIAKITTSWRKENPSLRAKIVGKRNLVFWKSWQDLSDHHKSRAVTVALLSVLFDKLNFCDMISA